MVTSASARSGQTVLEFVVLLSLFTFLGLFLYYKVSVPGSGAVDRMQGSTTEKIAKD
jgi:hypothetical protein